MKKRIILFLISFSLIAALIYVSDPGQIAVTLSKTNPAYVGLALGFWMFGVLVRTGRWCYLLRRTGIEVRFLTLVKYYLAGMAVSDLSPAKSGDAIRPLFLKKIKGESFSRGLGSVLAERIFDIIALSIISLVSLSMLPITSPWMRWLYLAIVIYAVVIFFGVYLIFSGKMEPFLDRLVAFFSFVPRVKKLEARVEEFSGKLRQSLRKYRNPGTLAVTLLISILVWLIVGLLVKSVFLSLGENVPLLVILAVYSTGILLGLLTFLPGALGSNEVIQASLYGTLLTLSTSTITSALLLTRMANFFIYVLIGAILLSTMPKELVDF